VFCQYPRVNTWGKQTLNSPRPAKTNDKLLGNRPMRPLFEMPRFTGNIEAAYTPIRDRYQAKSASDNIVF